MRSSQEIKPDRFLAFYVPSLNWNKEIDDQLNSIVWLHSVGAFYLFEGTEYDYHRAFGTVFFSLGDLDQDAREY